MNGNGELATLLAQGSTVHLMGIGGAGMAGLALLLAARGARVSGCDQETNRTTRDLERQGMAVFRGHDPAHTEGVAAVVHTSAVSGDHPELEAARSRGVPVMKRSEALAQLVNTGSLIAIAGTHGKTTTAALTALALEAVGLDPTALVGGRVPAWGGNARIGHSTTYVVEADEYDRSFLSLWPQLTVVTSVEAEHLDTYATFAELEAAFDEFADRVPPDGRVIACVDDAGACRLLEGVGERGLGYGLGSDATLRAESISFEPTRTSFSLRCGTETLGEFELALHGRHNVLNALAALGVLLTLGQDPRPAAPLLASFTGVERRFQKLGEARGITVVDDYAHHPTEVAATLETASQLFGDRRLVVAFQPHLYSRTRAFAGDFARVLAGADLLFVTGIYAAREAPIAGVTAEVIVAAAREQIGERVHYAEDLSELMAGLRAVLREGDVLVTIGAGDIGGIAHAMLAELQRSHVDA